jgi:Fe-Mn family superoxide dismutase
MKVTVKHIDSGLSSEDKKMYNDFIKFINSKYPVNKELTILFLGKKSGHMSTGSQNLDGTIKVLSRNRLNRDIMRTLAHEWVHAHQRLVLGRERGPDIGGQNEDEANAFAGRLIKMFEKQYPNYNSLVFESTTKLMKNVQLLNEQIILTEKVEIKNNFLMEMKRIGIEKLPYSYSAMNQFVDPETMDIHYNKHYKGYVKKLNDALSGKNYKDLELEDIIKSISKFVTKVRNNAGGAFNHALFWKMLSPKKQKPFGEIYKKIKSQYGNIKKLKDEFNQEALDRFGSGWTWLVLTKNNKLKVMSTPNQDNPLMNIIKDGGYPLLGLDVWEHAYYLRYRNKRDEYVKNFWDHINWEFVNDLFISKSKKKLTESIKRIIVENETIDPDLKKAMSRELQKIRLIPLDAEASREAIDNIVTAEIERGSLKFNREITGLMSLDLTNVSERSRFRFNNYYQRWVKSRTRGFDFEALIAGLLDGEMALSQTSPFDVQTSSGDLISCKTIRNTTEEKIGLKSIKKSVVEFLKDYAGSEDNKTILNELSEYPDFIERVLHHPNSDIRNVGEDLIKYLLKEITGMLVGVPDESNTQIKLFYFTKETLINLCKIKGIFRASKTLGAQTLTFSKDILNVSDPDILRGQIQFPVLSLDDYKTFLLGDENTNQILLLFNKLGDKYGVARLGDNIPQDIIRNLSKNDQFKLDLGNLVNSKL